MPRALESNSIQWRLALRKERDRRINRIAHASARPSMHNLWLRGLLARTIGKQRASVQTGVGVRSALLVGR